MQDIVIWFSIVNSNLLWTLLKQEMSNTYRLNSIIYFLLHFSDFVIYYKIFKLTIKQFYIYYEQIFTIQIYYCQSSFIIISLSELLSSLCCLYWSKIKLLWDIIKCVIVFLRNIKIPFLPISNKNIPHHIFIQMHFKNVSKNNEIIEWDIQVLPNNTISYYYKINSN